MDRGPIARNSPSLFPASLVCAFAALAAGSPLPAATPTPDASLYARDVEFLLTQLQDKADHFFKLKGIDWPAVAAQFREEVKSVKSDADHVRLARRLVARLRDGHAWLQDVKIKEVPDDSQGRTWAGPGIHLLATGDRVFVRRAYRPAAEAGLKPGIEVSRIEGLPAVTWLKQRVEQLRDDTGYSTSHQALYAACHWGLGGWSGSHFACEVIAGADKKTLNLTRAPGSGVVPVGPVFFPPNLRRTGRQTYGLTENGFGYIHLRDIPGTLPAQLDAMLEAIGRVPGLVLDLRANGGGGCDHAAVFGRFLPTNTTWREYASSGPNPYSGPLVVIVDAGTRSAGETVAAMLKERGRAYLIGDTPTAGTSSQKENLQVPSGLFTVHFSVRSNGQRYNNGQGIEGIGIPPHETVPYDQAELLRGVDTLLRRAGERLRQGLPADKVPYEASRPAK